MHQQPHRTHRTEALALAALLLAISGTEAPAQFQFLTDGPRSMNDETRRSPEDRDPAPAAPREKKGFFGRLFSRDEQPPQNRGYVGDNRAPAPPPAYVPLPGPTTYVRDGVRYSNPPREFAPAAVPAAPPTGTVQWTPVQPGYSANPPATYDGRLVGAAAGLPPAGPARPLSNPVVSDGNRYRVTGQPPANYYPAPNSAPAAATSSGVRDAFTGQRLGGELNQPAPAPQYAPAPAAPAAPWPATRREFPSPAPATSRDSIDRPGFFSRLFGQSGAEPQPQPTPRYTVREGMRHAPDPQTGPPPRTQPQAAWGTPAPVAQPLAPQDYQPAAVPQPVPGFAPAAPLEAQDPFSGQRPSRRLPPPTESFPQPPQNPVRQPTPSPFGTPRSSLDAPPAFAPVAPPGNLSPAEQRIFGQGVKPEDQRYLMYLYAKTGRADLAEPLAQGILARDPTNHEALLAMSAVFVDRKQPDKALAYASELYRTYPDSKDALYYYGAASQLAGNYRESAAVLRHLRLDQFAGKPFPYQLDLAAAAEKSGDWRAQMTAYQELLDQNTVDDPTRRVVRRVLEPMQREHSDHLSAQATAYHLDSGQLWQERAAGRTQLDGRNQLHADALREDVLIRASPLLRRRWADDTEGQVGLQTTWSQRWLTDLWAGGSQAGPLGGARLMHRFPSNGALWLEAYASERARDGLLLNSLDGRQHRLTLAGNYLIAERFQTYGALTGREVQVNDERLAVGVQGNWGVEFLARRESPEFKLGYRGTYHANTRKSNNLALVAPAVLPGTTLAQQTQVLDSAVLHWLHREGVYADLRDRLWGPFFYHLFGGADYAFERDSIEFTSRAGLTFQPRKSLEFGTEIAYTTSAATADGASGLWELGLTAKWWF